MSMCSLIEFSDNYMKTLGGLQQFCSNKPAVNNNGVVVAFSEANVTDFFNFKVNTTCCVSDNCTKNVEILVPLKYLSNFGKLLKCH